MKTYHSFNTPEAMQEYMRKHVYKEGEWDYVTVHGIVYTMDEYDSDGKYLTWGNMKHNKQLRVDTSNRYSESGFTDSVVYVFDDWGLFRNDITYYE